MLKKIFYVFIISAIVWSLFVSSCSRQGRVVDAETKRPIAGVQVTIRYSRGHTFRLPMQESDTWGGCFATRVSQTNDDGYYTIPAVLPWYKVLWYLLHPRKYAAYTASFYKYRYYTATANYLSTGVLEVGSGNRYGFPAPLHSMRKDVLTVMHKLEYLSFLIYWPLDYCRGATSDTFKADITKVMQAEILSLIPQWESILLEKGDDALPVFTYRPETITPLELFSDVVDYKPQGLILEKLRSLDALYDWKAAGYDKE